MVTNTSFKKVAIIGAGFVGATTAYTLMLSGLIPEIVLIDINQDKAEGEVMDLNHGMPFIRPEKVYAGQYEDCHDADIIIITAGANQKPGETRLDLVHRNTKIFKNIIGEITKYNQHCILLVVANPVDILTFIAYKLSGFPANKVIGSGTVLDSARFRYTISQYVGLDTRNIHGYIIGEHGDSELPTWSVTNISGVPLDDYYRANFPHESSELPKDEIFQQVKNAAYQIIEKKGATYYGVALAVRRIVEAIVRDENSILSISSYLDGPFDLHNVCLSLPSIVNKDGIKRIVDIPLNETERILLHRSEKALKEILEQLDI